jgi:NADP-dependent 3-hydroxy acid dehydrogenase YdfG
MSQELVVITGASSGIGRGIARAFAAEGNPLLLISRHIAPLPEFEGKPVRYAQADVVDYAQVARPSATLVRPDAWSTARVSSMPAIF